MRYISVDKIASIRLMCRKVLPAVYDESLSYLEGLCKLTYKVNETIESVNALNDNVGILNDSVTELNARVEAVEGEISGFEAEITARFNQLESTINAEVDAKLEDVENRVSRLEHSIDQQIAEFERTITAELNRLEAELTGIISSEIERINSLYALFEADMKAYVYKEIQEALKQIPDLTTIYVINPTTGKLTKIQDVVNNIFIFSAYNAFTIDEYNQLGLTVNEINDIMVKSMPRGLTAYEWMHDAKKILVTQVDPAIAESFAYPHSIVRNYLDGTKVWHDRNVDINQQLIAVSGCYSCDELVTLAYTVDEIVAFNISCYDFIMNANSLMVRSA